MNSKLSIFLILLLMLLAGCNGHEIETLRGEQTKHNQRLVSLEDWQKAVNSNIASLQGIITAFKENDYVASVTSSGTGYILNFIKIGSLIVENGKGNNGSTPLLGVKKDADNLYYWTLNGNWLVDVAGKKMPVADADGKKGVVPQLRINDSQKLWEISVDGGNTWISTGIKATDGKTEQNDAVFAKNGIDITNPDYVEFILADGTTKIRLPRYKALGIGADDGNGIIELTQKNTTIPLRLPSNFKETDYSAILAEVKSDNIGIATRGTLTENEWRITVKKPTFKADGTCNNDAAVTVTLPPNIHNGALVVLEVSLLDTRGGKIVTARTLSPKGLTTVTPPDPHTVYVLTPGSLTAEAIFTALAGGTELIVNGELNADDWKTLKDAVNELPSAINLTLRDVIEVPEEAFRMSRKIKTVSLPAVITIKEAAFLGCNALKTVSASMATSIGNSAFSHCISLTSVSLFEAKTIDKSAFSYCTALESVSLPVAIAIGNKAFEECMLLSAVSLPKVITVGKMAFSSCKHLQDISLPEATTIGEDALAFCTRMKTISLPKVVSIGNRAFDACLALVSLTLSAVGDISLGGDGNVFNSAPTATIFLTLNRNKQKQVTNNTWQGLTFGIIKFVDTL